MLSTTQLQDEVIRLQIRIAELERENSELKAPPQHHHVSKVESPRFDSLPPPPPPLGAPPPPPPAIGQMLKPQTRKPKVKMRGLFWTRMRRPAGQNRQRSLWDQVERSEGYLDDKLCHALEAEYCVVQKGKSDTRSKTSQREPRYIEVLDSKRATNLGIQLSSLPENWFNALEQIELNTFSEEKIEQLKLALPSKEDLSEIETAQANWPNRELGAAERFLLQLGSVTWAQERLVCWSFLLRCRSSAASLAHRCDLLRAAVFELRLEPSIARLMSLVLSAGNYLNNGTGRGDAYGFGFGILPGLADMKNNSRNSNLLRLVAEQARSRQLLGSSVAGSVELLGAAGRFMLSEVENQLAVDSAEFATCLRMQEYVASRDPESRVVTVFQPMLNDFQEPLASLQRDVSACHAEFNELLGWLGMSVAEMSTVSSSDFFSIWSKFLGSLVQ